MSARSRCPIRGSTSSPTIGKSAQIIPTRMTFVDIAGLVRGASKGEGLGNQFLANIREVDAIAHVRALLRGCRHHPCRGQDRPDRRHRDHRDRADARRPRQPREARRHLEKKAKGSDKEAKEQLDLVNRALVLLRDGKPARLRRAQAGGGAQTFRMLRLLTSKPVLYVCNVEEGSAATATHSRSRSCEQAQGGRRRRRRHLGQDRGRDRHAVARRTRRIPRDARPEEAGLDRLIRAGYELLDLITYFTVGPKEARAWTIDRGTKAPRRRRRHPHRFREGLHPRRDHRL